MNILKTLAQFIPVIWEVVKIIIKKKEFEYMYIIYDKNNKIIAVTLDYDKALSIKEKNEDSTIETHIIKK
jgi:hypothetical protein